MDMAWAGVSQAGGHRQPLGARECGGSRSGLVLSLREELRTRRGRGNAWYTPGQTLGGSPPRTLWTHPDSLKLPVQPSEPLSDPWGHWELSHLQASAKAVCPLPGMPFPGNTGKCQAPVVGSASHSMPGILDVTLLNHHSNPCVICTRC